MKSRHARSRIVTLLGLAALVGAINVFGRGYVEQTLGWTGSALPLFMVSAGLSLLAVWNFLGLFTNGNEKDADRKDDHNS